MDTKVLDKKLNRAFMYTYILKMGIFILSLSMVAAAILMAGVFIGNKDEGTIRLVTVGLLIASVLLIGIGTFFVARKKEYSRLLGVDETTVSEIIEDINNLELDAKTFSLGRKYAYFYGKLVRNHNNFLCVKYEEIARAKFAPWHNNEQILFYDKNGEWIATVGGYKRKTKMIRSILLNKGVSQEQAIL